MQSALIDNVDPELYERDNPFAGRIVDEPWTTRADAPTVHARAGEELFQLVNQVGADGGSRLALLIGESGAGKSHLLARLRKRVEAQAFFIFVDPYVTRERMFRHVVLRLVDSLWRPDEEEVRPLERYLDEVLLKTLDAYVDGDPGALTDHCRRFEHDVRSGDIYRDAERSRYIPTFIEQVLGEPARLAGKDALRALGATRTENAPLALDWLRGHELDPEELALLGVDANPGGEDQARRTIVALAALVEGAGPLVLCFDQTESLPADEQGRADLEHLIGSLETLKADARNLVLIVTCLGEVLREVRREIKADARASILGLSPESARALVTARIAKRIAPRDPPFLGYPFSDAFYNRLGDRATARDILTAAAREVERLRRRERKGAAPEVDPDAHWRAVYREYERRAADDPVATDEVLAWSLATAIEWRAAAGLTKQISAPEGFAVSWAPPGGAVGIAISSTRDGGAFVQHLRTLLGELSRGAFRRALLIRRGEISDGWSAAPFMLESYGRGGGLISGIDPVSETQLRTLRHLRLAAEGGDVRGPDGAVAPVETVALGIAQSGIISDLPVVRLVERSLGG